MQIIIDNNSMRISLNFYFFSIVQYSFSLHNCNDIILSEIFTNSRVKKTIFLVLLHFTYLGVRYD